MSDDKKNIILIDWFAMSFRQEGITPFDIIEHIGIMENIPFRELPGRYCYKHRLSFGHINIYYDHYKADCNFPMLEMSGQGCREFETFSKKSFDDLFEMAKDEKNYHITRLDVAYDDHSGILDIKKIMLDGHMMNFVSRCEIIDLHERITKQKHLRGYSIMTGTKSSDIYMRIYDKAIERGFDDGRHWIRCELVLKQQRAVEFIKNPQPIGEKFRGVIHNYFRFVTPNKNDTHKDRWSMRKYWSDFLGDAEKIKLYTPKDIDYNLSRLGGYIFGQAGNSIETYIHCVGVPVFLEELLSRNSKLNPKQKHVVNECKLLFEAGEPISFDTVRKIQSDYDNRYKQLVTA